MYTTAATQMQGARLTAGRRRRSDCLTTFEILLLEGDFDGAFAFARYGDGYDVSVSLQAFIFGDE